MRYIFSEGAPMARRLHYIFELCWFFGHFGGWIIAMDSLSDNSKKASRPNPETSGNPPARIRKAIAWSLYPGMLREFEQRCRAMWPEVIETLRSHGVHNYSIFLQPETRILFVYLEIDDEIRWQAIARTSAFQLWWHHMADIVPTNPDLTPIVRDLKEVFHLQ